MAFAAELKKIVEDAGLQTTVLAKLAGISRQEVWRVLKGAEPTAKTEQRIRTALAQVAAIVAPAEGDATPHPGATDLAADADLLAAYRVSEEELAGLRECVIVWKGRPLVVRSKYAAIALLEAIRRVLGEVEG